MEKVKTTRIYELELGEYSDDTYSVIDNGNPDDTLKKLPLSALKGTDGVSPEVTIIPIEPSGGNPGGYDVTITDKEHPSGQTFEIRNGVTPPVAPNDAFYVNRGGTWVKVYDLTSVPIEGFPVDNADEYQKLSVFNGWLHPYVAIGVEGTATVGLFNYDTMQYDKEITVTDGMTTTMVSVGGNYEIHAKGANGVVTVVVSADSFDDGGSSDA